jgi:hypothetical protein
MLETRRYRLVVGISVGLTAICAFPGPALAQQKTKLRPLQYSSGKSFRKHDGHIRG